MKNKLLKGLLSVVIALGVWLYVVTVVSPNSDKNYNNIPVIKQSEALLHERGFMITEMDTDTVSLHLEGSRIDLNKLNSSNIAVTLDVSKIYGVGTHTLTYSITTPGDVPSNAVNVLGRTPGTITVKVEERITKEIPIDVKYSGSLADNFMADTENKEMNVDSISITGPKSVVDQIEVAIINIDLEGKSESISGQFTYTLCDKNDAPVDAKLVTTDVANVELTLRIMRVKEIALNINVVEGGGATLENTKITLSPETIWVSGSDSLLEGLESLDLGSIYLSELQEDQTLTFPIKLPEGITDESGVTEAMVEVTLPHLASKMLTVKSFNAVNIPEGFDVDILTKSLEVQIRGPEGQVRNLEDSDVIVTVDFTDAQTGTIKVKAQITTDNPAVGAVGIYTVSATVREEG